MENLTKSTVKQQSNQGTVRLKVQPNIRPCSGRAMATQLVFQTNEGASYSALLHRGPMLHIIKDGLMEYSYFAVYSVTCILHTIKRCIGG